MKIYNIYGKLLDESESKDFSNKNLSGADLSGANLIAANLSDADLSGANLIAANLSGANLSGADLSGANLIAANLSDANLSDANLIAANLSDAKINNTIGNMREIKSLHLNKYIITFTKYIMAIGCKQYIIEEWFNFNDEQIENMDDGALKWWNKWKEYIKQTIELSKNN